MKDGLCAGSVVFVLFSGIAFGLCGAKAAGAQEVPRWEMAAGYTFLRDQDLETSFPLGWYSSSALNLTRSLGVVAEAGGSYKTEEGVKFSMNAYLVGARYAFRGERLTPYAEALVGAARLTVSAGGASESGSDLAAQLGAGIGYKVSDRVSLRTGVDFRNIFTEGTSLQEFRVHAGLGVAFGELGGGSSPEPRSAEPSAPRVQDRSGQDRYGIEVPRYELSLGYAYLRDEEINIPVGWSTSFAMNFTNSLGAVADVGGSYKTVEVSGISVDSSIHSFLVGSRYSFRGERVTPYVEGLIGVARFSGSGGGVSASDSDFAVQFGVGIGYKVSDRVSLRTGADFRNVSIEGGSTQQYRVHAGVSFGFGGSREGPAVDSTERYEPLPPRAPTTVAPAPVAPPPAQPARPAPQPQAPPTRLPAPAPAPAPPPAGAPAPAPLGKARELLSTGSYPQAADAFRADLPVQAPNMFTIPVGVYCDASNLAQLVRSVDARELVLVRLMLRGQACYGLYWGLFASGSEAQAAMAKIPPTLRAPGQTPISVSRMLTRAR